MSTHAYPPSAVRSDMARSGAGVLFAGVPLLALDTLPVVTALLIVLLALFLFYGVQGIRRDLSPIEMDGLVLRVRGWIPSEILWRDVDLVRLRYYSTRRDRSGGWLQLTIGSGRKRLEVDSRLDAFDAVVRRAVAVARANGATLDPTTLSNLRALRISETGLTVEGMAW